MTSSKYTIIPCEAGWLRVSADYNSNDDEAYVIESRPIIAWAVPADEELGTLALTPGEGAAAAQALIEMSNVAFVTPDGLWLDAVDEHGDEASFLEAVRRGALRRLKFKADMAARKAAKAAA